MNARNELRDWIEEHRPDLFAALNEPPEIGLPKLNEASGLHLLVEHLYKYGADHICQMYLAALKLSAEEIEIAAPAKPKKPPPALPVEVWQDGAFDADRAWQATIAACKGVR